MDILHSLKPRSLFLLGASVLASGLFAACGSDDGGTSGAPSAGGSRPTGGSTSVGGASMAVGGAAMSSGGGGNLGGMAGTSGASGAAGMMNASGASGAGTGGGQNVGGAAGVAATGGSSGGGASGSAATGGTAAGGTGGAPATGGAAGAAGAMCTGSATACSAFDTMQASCGNQTGCAIDGLCVAKDSGAAGAANTACGETHRTAVSCAQDANCEWRFPCRPKASNTDCSSKANQGTCNAVAGCLWLVNQCIQNISACDFVGLDQSACTNDTNGKCQWVTDYIGCNGTPNACSSFSNNTCSGQAGCSVQ
ncbi:MAG: hypothetical protein SFV15_26960 [Polyangiaceae bacterium]|nr:hypothetical protein [Polyangiaceae bacterium]